MDADVDVGGTVVHENNQELAENGAKRVNMHNEAGQII